jgi:hypothetical protein
VTPQKLVICKDEMTEGAEVDCLCPECHIECLGLGACPRGPIQALSHN